MPDHSTIDPQAIDALRDMSPEGGDEFLRELVDIFLADTPRRLAELEEAIGRQDAPTATRAAHSIKGSAGNFGARRLTAMAQELEQSGKAADLTGAAAAAANLREEYARVARALAPFSSGTNPV